MTSDSSRPTFLDKEHDWDKIVEDKHSSGHYYIEPKMELRKAKYDSNIFIMEKLESDYLVFNILAKREAR